MKSTHINMIHTFYHVDISNPKEIIGSDSKFHYFYKIINKINNKFYFGIHSTNDINDNYIGSGVILKTAYKKYGIENFEKHILKFFSDRKSLLEYEKEIVCKDLVDNCSCYNITIGGKGTLIHEKSYFGHTTKGLIHINNGLVNKLVKPNELERYISNGWKIGENFKSCKGKVVISNGSNEMFVFQEEVEKYISKGWTIGGKSRNKGNSSHAKDKVWMNNGIETKRITKECIKEYENNGWKIGTLQKHTTGYIRITNGFEDKNIDPTNKQLLIYYLEHGWKKGSFVKRNGRVWISKENKTLMIVKDKLNEYLKQGWIVGRITKKQEI